MNSSRTPLQFFTTMSDQELEAAIFAERFTVEEKTRCEKLLALRSSAKRDAPEEETLAIAKDANRLASEANSIAHSQAAAARRSARWAMWAALIAAVAAIAANKEQILALFG